jgi:hypothetical protein
MTGLRMRGSLAARRVETGKPVAAGAEMMFDMGSLRMMMGRPAMTTGRLISGGEREAIGGLDADDV